MQTACFYAYTIQEFENSGIYVMEDTDGWLYVKDDTYNRKYFSIDEIEEDLDCTLVLRKQHITIEHTLN